MFTALNENLTNQSSTSFHHRIPPPINSAELEEAKLVRDYKSALQNLANNDVKMAKEELQRLLNSPLFRPVKNVLSKSSTVDKKYEKLARILNAVLKNLAHIAVLEKDDELATKYYSQAVKLLKDDVATWYNFGLAAFKSDQFNLARLAFEQVLEISPEHWLCLERLICLLFVLGDYANCLIKISAALRRNENHVRSLIIRDEIFDRCPYFIENYAQLFSKLKANENYSEKDRKFLIERLDELNQKLAVDFSEVQKIGVYEPDAKFSFYKWSSLAEYLLRINDELDKKNKTLATPILLLKSDQQIVDHTVGGVAPISDQLDSSLDNVVDVSSSEMQSESESGSNVQHTKRHKRKWTKNYDPASGKGRRGSTGGSGSDPPDNKRRSSRLIPGFFIEDPEAFGPLTTKPVNLREQLYSYVPACLKNVPNFPEKSASIECPAIYASTADCSASFGSIVDENFEEISTFLTENGSKSYSSVLHNFLAYFSRYETISLRWPDSLRNDFLALHQVWKTYQQMNGFHFTQCAVYLAGLELQRGHEQGGAAMEIESEGISCHLSYFLKYQLLNNQATTSAELSRFACRFFWLKCKRLEKRKQFNLAVASLQNCLHWFTVYLTYSNLVETHIDRFYCDTILLANSSDKIETATIQSKIGYLHRLHAFSQAEKALEDGRYEFIVKNMHFSAETQQQLNDQGLEKCKRLYIVCKAYANLQDYCSMQHLVADLLSAQVTAYHDANFRDIAGHFKKFDEILHWALQCYEKDEFFLEMNDNDEHNRRLKILLDALIDVILISIDFSDNNVRLADEILPASCWLDPFLLLYETCKRAEMRTFDIHCARGWWSTRRGDVITGYNFVLLATKSLMIFNVAHEELGKRRLCAKDGGKLLTKFVEELMSILRLPLVAENLPSALMDDTLNCAEQCFYCLYGYPRKRSRCIVEHGAVNVELKWSLAGLLFDFVRPEESPEFDDNPHGNFSSETVHLLHRLEDLVPETLKPDRHLTKLDAFIRGDVPTFDLNSANAVGQQNTSNSDDKCLSIVCDLYHLIADYYGKLKEKDLQKVCKYYELDLCVNQDRGDSWAGLALHKAALIEKMLSSLDLKYNDEEIRKISNKSKTALFCFDRAINFLPNHVILLVEKASLSYNVHAFTSRSLKRRSCSRLENRACVHELKQHFLLAARNAFETARKIIECLATGEHSKDAWIVNYMLGKICEKFKEKFAPSIFLPYYHRAAYHLHVEGARYPLRIPYTAPRFAYEALEVFFRIYASSLKWLFKTSSCKTSIEFHTELALIWRYLELFSNSPLRKNHRSMEIRTASYKNFLAYDPDAYDCVETLLSAVSQESSHLQTSVEQLMRKIVAEIIEVMQILGQKPVHPYYKAYYRLAYLFHDGLSGFKDEILSRRVLLGKSVSGSEVIDGCLFQNFKGQQLFEGIWLIPADDVSRPGSFAAYLYKSVSLLIDVLQKLGDIERLIDLSKILIRKPANLQSQYLKEWDRQELSCHVFSLSDNLIRRIFDKSANQESQRKICVIAYRFYSNLEATKFDLHSSQWYKRVLTYFYSALCKTNLTTNRAVVLSFFERLTISQYSNAAVHGDFSHSAGRPQNLKRPMLYCGQMPKYSSPSAQKISIPHSIDASTNLQPSPSAAYPPSGSPVSVEHSNYTPTATRPLEILKSPTHRPQPNYSTLLKAFSTLSSSRFTGRPLIPRAPYGIPQGSPHFRPSRLNRPMLNVQNVKEREGTNIARLDDNHI